MPGQAGRPRHRGPAAARATSRRSPTASGGAGGGPRRDRGGPGPAAAGAAGAGRHPGLTPLASVRMTERQTDEASERAPKVLLHAHLEGGLRPATVIDLAREYGYDRLPTTD